MPFDGSNFEVALPGFNRVQPQRLPPGWQPEPLIPSIEKARGILDRDGWIKGQYRSEGGVCLVGAFRAAFGKYQRLPHRLVRIMGFNTEEEMWDWNDRPHRESSDVFGRLDNAVRILRERGEP